MPLQRKIAALAFHCLILFSFVLNPSSLIFNHGSVAFAQTADELQQKIDQRNKDISDLENQIKGYQGQIESLGTQANTLTATIKSLDLTQKKLAASIEITQNRIAEKNLEIQRLGLQINSKKSAINDDERIIRQSFVDLSGEDTLSVEQIFLSSKSISDVMNSLDSLTALESNIRNRVGKLNLDKTALESNKADTEKARRDLVALNNQLNDQQKVVLATAAEKKNLLAQTHQSEAAYKQILADKKKQEEAFQQEVSAYESQLHLLVNPNLIPHTGSGVLAWPLDKIVITQYFGNTPFATANPQIYSGKGHTGVDFGTTIGTPVKAALTGTVVGLGNTDLYAGCYSFGKWIMIKHPDGLSTLYAHLSVQSVSMGDNVSTGQIIAYSGNTGYSTGPHLHFGVYATQGVVIKAFEAGSHCQGAVIPFADPKAYLNPLSFL